MMMSANNALKVNIQFCPLSRAVFERLVVWSLLEKIACDLYFMFSVEWATIYFVDEPNHKHGLIQYANAMLQQIQANCCVPEHFAAVVFLLPNKIGFDMETGS